MPRGNLRQVDFSLGCIILSVLLVVGFFLAGVYIVLVVCSEEYLK